jgi:hypothetical protein
MTTNITMPGSEIERDVNQYRRPVDEFMQAMNAIRRDRRTLVNRRNTLASEIVKCSRGGDGSRVPFLRAEMVRVNEQLHAVENKFKSLSNQKSE